MSTSLRLVVLGMMGRCPFGGQTWLYLNWLRGLQRLGHDGVVCGGRFRLALRSNPSDRCGGLRVRGTPHQGLHGDDRTLRSLGIPPVQRRSRVLGAHTGQSYMSFTARAMRSSASSARRSCARKCWLPRSGSWSRRTRSLPNSGSRPVRNGSDPSSTSISASRPTARTTARQIAWRATERLLVREDPTARRLELWPVAYDDSAPCFTTIGHSSTER